MQFVKREYKGSSLLAFPLDCTVLDLETTGLDPSLDEIIEISAIRIRSGNGVEVFTSFIRPNHPISAFITMLTGITNTDLVDAPSIKDALSDFLSFVGNDIVVGHNVNFDVNFLYDNAYKYLGIPFQNDFVDTMRISRKVLYELEHHRLSDVAAAVGVYQEGAHRALADCITTYRVLQNLQSIAFDRDIDIAKHTQKHAPKLRACDISAHEGMQKPDHMLFGKVCVFTGALEKMQRKDAMQMVVDIGGICSDRITAKTNFLILGNNDYCTTIKDGKSSKQKKAEELILKGQDLQIISENTFYDLIEA